VRVHSASLFADKTCSRHSKTHTRPYECNNCGRGFALRLDLARHVKARHRVGLSRHECPVQHCTFTATREDNLNRHLRKKHECEQVSAKSGTIEETVLPAQSKTGSDSDADSLQVPTTALLGDERFWSHETLFLAAAAGNVFVLQTLLDSGLSTTACTDDGSSALHCAARAGQIGSIEVLLGRGASLMAKNKKGRLPFHEAVLSGSLETVQLFIEIRARLDIDETTANCIAECGGADIADLCLRYLGKDLHPGFMLDALNTASALGDLSTVALLLSKSASSTTSSASKIGDSDSRADLFDRCQTSQKSDVGRYTPMHHAAAHGQLAVVQLLSKHEINFNLVGRFKRTSLHLAAREGHAKVVELLLGLDGADVNCMDTFNRTPLHWATKRGKIEVIRVLLRHPGIKTRCQDKGGQTALRAAAFYRRWDVAKMLLEHEEDRQHGRSTCPNSSRVRVDLTPELVKRLLKHPDFQGVNNSAFRRGGLLHSAVRKGECEVLGLLLDHEGINVNLENDFGMTPLLLAVDLDRVEAVELLLRHKDIDLQSEGWYGTPLQRAKEKGHAQSVDLLLAHGAVDHSATPIADNDVESSDTNIAHI
jgi:ankyrin repeat protein